MTEQRELLFVSTRFLFPVDSGGKIRTTQILRGLKGGAFRIVLLSPATDELVTRHRAELDAVCDEFQWWPLERRSRLFHYARLRHVVGTLPIPVRTDRQRAGIAAVVRLLQRRPAIAVFDFAHAAVLAPAALSTPSVMFTHNVEAEIFKRHLDVAGNAFERLFWRNQHRKMHRYESDALRRFDVVVAVADRDARYFATEYGVPDACVIPTGVDLDFFGYAAPQSSADVVFCGSMDWLANQEAVTYFMDQVWHRIAVQRPDAKMTVVGRAPPRKLVAEAERRGFNWAFTGFVDDVRKFVRGAGVSVLPLRVGGGTRLKVYETMAMGTPLVSTAIGVEGLPLKPGEHYLLADGAAEMADAVVSLLTDRARRDSLARAAREHVERSFSYRVAAQFFEDACKRALSAGMK